jgi:hypothetical protein
LLDRAEILYRQVAGADPRNSIAVVGLARVTLERGDEPGALKLARRALAIDPENAAAQRMTQRLEEVLRFRGADVPAAVPPASASGPPPQRASLESTVTTPPEAPKLTLAAPRPPSPEVPPAELPPTPEVPPTAQPRGSRSLIDRLLRRRR